MAGSQMNNGKTLQDLTDDLAALREDFAKLSSSIRDVLQGQASATTQRMADAVDDARQKLAGEVAGAKSHLDTMTTDLEHSIERNPLAAIMIGAAVGFLIGLMSRPQK